MQSLATWLLSSGGFGALLWLGYRLHSDAVRAERGRADDWRTAAQTTAEANRVLSTSIDKLAEAVERSMRVQDEILRNQQDLLRRRRGAA